MSRSPRSRFPRPVPVRLTAATLACATVAAALAAAASGALAAGVSADRKRPQSSSDAPCAPTPADRTKSAVVAADTWLSSAAYTFPFDGWTPRGRGTVIWKKSPNGARKTHYPAPNLPSCRVALRGSEDRTSRKAGRYSSTLNAIDGKREYQLRDSFDRHVAYVHWQETSPSRRYPERWGWYVNNRWAGHGATRFFEIQGNACKFRAETTQVGDPAAPITVRTMVRDHGWAMIAINPALGSPNRKYRPRRTGEMRIRAFIDKRAIPGWSRVAASTQDFGCGTAPETPMFAAQPVWNPGFESGYGPSKNHREYMIDQYFGEGISPLALLPGESRTHNNMPLDVYNARGQYGGAIYAMNNTTGVAGGGMVRGLARAGTDSFTLYDEMTYCDSNHTLAGMLLKRNGRRVSKWSYFELAHFSRLNKPAVRWVYGQINPDHSTLSPEMADAANNPASQRLYAWMPLRCDRPAG